MGRSLRVVVGIDIAQVVGLGWVRISAGTPKDVCLMVCRL